MTTAANWSTEEQELLGWSLKRFRRQYLQQVSLRKLQWPPAKCLRLRFTQVWLWEHLFAGKVGGDEADSRNTTAVLPTLHVGGELVPGPPHGYRLSVLKNLLLKIEFAVEPDDVSIRHSLSGRLMLHVQNSICGEAGSAQVYTSLWILPDLAAPLAHRASCSVAFSFPFLWLFCTITHLCTSCRRSWMIWPTG